MNNSNATNVMHLIKSSTGLRQYVYVLFFIAGIFFTGSAIFTLLRTASIVATMNPVPSITFLFTGLFILVQAMLAYGFLRARDWLAYALGAHAISLVVMASLVLPYYGWTDAIRPTVVSGTGIFVLTIIVFACKSHLLATQRPLIPAALYTLSLIVIATLSVMIRL